MSGAGDGPGQRRRRLPGGRQGVHRVRVSPEEELRLRVLADEANLSVPAYLMDCALRAGGADSVKVRREALVELFAVHRLLGTVANNVNQLAKHANATGQVRQESVAALAHARQVMDRIDASIEALAL